MQTSTQAGVITGGSGGGTGMVVHDLAGPYHGTSLLPWSRLDDIPTLSTTSPLRIDGGASADLSTDRTLSVTLNAAGAIIDSTGLAVQLSSTGGLEVNTNALRVKLPANSGMVRDATGLYLSPSNLTTTTTNAVSGSGHTHFLDTSANPGAAAKILQSDGAGLLTLVQLTASTKVRTPTIDTASGDLTLSPATGITALATLTASAKVRTDLVDTASASLTLSPTGSAVLPTSTIVKDLGDYNRKWRTLYAAELYVETLVAQDVLATIGGRVLVAPTTTLIADLSSGATTIDVKHNNLHSGTGGSAVGAYVYLSTAPGGIAQIEVIKVANGASPTVISGGYRYSITTRNVDGSGANSWVSGDAVVNLGSTVGQGYIDLTSTNTVHSHLGPTITIYSRTSMSTWNSSKAVVTMGNLRSFVDYGADEFGFGLGNDLTLTPTTGFIGLTADRTNGLRLFNVPLEMYDGSSQWFDMDASNGLAIIASTAATATRGYKFTSSGGTLQSGTFAWSTGSTTQVMVSGNGTSTGNTFTRDGLASLYSFGQATASATATSRVEAQISGSGNSFLTVNASFSGTNTIVLDTENITLTSSLNTVNGQTLFNDTVTFTEETTSTSGGYSAAAGGSPSAYTPYKFNNVDGTGLMGHPTSSYVGVAIDGNFSYITRTDANDSYIRLGVGNTNSRHSYVDFFGDGAAPLQWSARLIRNLGTNGSMQLANTGTGTFSFSQANLGLFNWVLNGSEIARFDTSGRFGIGGTPSSLLHVFGNARAETLYADGDNGSITGTTAITNAFSTTISTGVGSIRTSGTTARTNTHWLKIYVGTTTLWVPAFTTITG